MDSFMPMSPAMLPQMMPTAGGMQQMMPFISPDQIAQNQADMAQWQQRQQMAQALMNTQIPAGGRATGIAGIFSKVLGAIQNNRNNDRLSDLLKQQFQIENQAAQAKRQQDIEDEHRKMLEEIQKGVAVARGTAQAGKEFAPDKIENGLRIGADGQVSAIPGWNDAAMALARQKAALDAANRPAPADPFKDIKTALAQGLITQQEATKRMHDVALGLKDAGSTGSDWQIVGSNRVNKVTGEVQPLNDASGKPIPTGADAKSSGVVDASKKLLATQVLNYVSTATGTPVEKLQTMTPDEVADHFQKNGANQVGNVVGRIPIIGPAIAQTLSPNLDSYATAAQAAEARIQHPVGTIPYNAEVLARKSSLGPEKTTTFNTSFIRSALKDVAGDSAAPPATATASDGHKIGDVLTVKGKQYRVVGGSPTDPDLVPL